MSIQCPICKHVLSTDGSIPRFCSACGSPLGATEVENQTNPLDPSPNANFEPTLALANPTARGGASRAASPHDDTIEHGSSNGDDANRSDRLPGDSVVGPFRIVRTLGQGGMGTVYEATHSETGQRVALKLLSRSVRTTEETIQRFQRESQIAASINHPRSTFVYQAGQHSGRFYITMELMTGGTLTDVVRDDGPVPFAKAVDHVLDIISGLQSAHHVGIVHRDLKPSNCFVDERGRVKIGDYGLAKSFLNDSSLTQTGAFMGTPQYAAPEQLRASDVDERADIYAIGGTLFYLLTGRAPFVGNAAQVIASITSEKPPKVDSIEVTVPRELSRIIHQTLEKDPARRPENLAALRQALLPFSTRGISGADIGRRMAAFFIDIAVVFLLIVFASQLIGMFAQLMSYTDLQQVFFLNIFVALFASVGYFAILEWQFGTTFGKWLLGMRVITDKNQSPGMLSALIRATLLPGISYVLNAIPAYLMDLDPFNPDIWVIIDIQVFQLLSWLPCLLCFVSARKSNSMRGLHEILSGTRVVRLAGALEYKRPRNVPVTSPVALDTPRKFGAFTALGMLGRRPEQGSSVLLGRDTSLDRDVWIVERAPRQPDPTWKSRKSLARPTRLRILDEQVEGDHRWIVTEAIRGMPLVDYVTQTPNVDWRSFRPLLRELTYELAKAEDDATVPVRLSLHSAWLDQAGRVKLLDQPIAPLHFQPTEVSGSVSDAAPLTITEDLFDSNVPILEDEVWLSPFGLIAGLLDEFIENQVVPAHVLTFRKELEIVKAEPESLRTIGKRLGELADQPSSWRWDDRIGVMAISIGIEYATASSVASTIALAGAYFLDFSFASIALIMVALGSLTAMLLGAVFGGGPIFRLTGVLVRRNKTLEPASPLRCAFRNWITWLPLIFLMACLAVVFEFFVKPGGMTPMHTRLSLSEIQNPWLIGAGLLSILLLVIVILAPIYSIFKPSRGIPDVIAGTRLIRK